MCKPNRSLQADSLRPQSWFESGLFRLDGSRAIFVSPGLVAESSRAALTVSLFPRLKPDQGTQAPFRCAFLSAFSVPRSSIPALRTHALPSETCFAPLRGMDSLPQTSWGLFP